MKHENEIDISNSVLKEVFSDIFKDRGIRLFIKRDDLIHIEISGNKWRKLKYNVEMCAKLKHNGILTFGGAYSNHLVATAAACNLKGINSIGIVRGDELTKTSNETLKRCSDHGMQLVFVSREEYKSRYEKSYQEHLLTQYPNHFIVNEGGANYYGMIGCQEIVKEIDVEFDSVFVAQGTTTTSCGIGMSLNDNQTLHVVPALKGYQSLEEMSALYLKSGFEQDYSKDILSNVIVHDDCHFGGYGKYSNELLFFINEFFQKHQIKLDPVYTGKAMYALFEEIKKGNLDNQNVIFIHTGGVQGAQSIIDKTGVNLYG